MKNSILRLLLSKGTFLLILFVILLLSSISAQEQFKRNELVVISPNGLNMRAEPYTRAKLMRKLPYGAKVGILEKLTKTEFTLTHEYKYYDKEGGLIHSDPLKGYWVKITYEGVDGYAFSPFLAPVYDRENQFGGNENYKSPEELQGYCPYLYYSTSIMQDVNKKWIHSKPNKRSCPPLISFHIDYPPDQT